MKLKKYLLIVKQKIKTKLLGIKKFISNCIEDILIFSGLTCIVIATFFISKIVGMYVLGVALLGLGIYFTKYPPRKG